MKIFLNQFKNQNDSVHWFSVVVDNFKFDIRIRSAAHQLESVIPGHRQLHTDGKRLMDLSSLDCLVACMYKFMVFYWYQRYVVMKLSLDTSQRHRVPLVLPGAREIGCSGWDSLFHEGRQMPYLSGTPMEVFFNIDTLIDIFQEEPAVDFINQQIQMIHLNYVQDGSRSQPAAAIQAHAAEPSQQTSQAAETSGV